MPHTQRGNEEPGADGDDKTRIDAHFGDPDFKQIVREKAYELWERDGRPQDSERHYWYLALAKCLQRREEDERSRRGLVDPM